MSRTKTIVIAIIIAIILGVLPVVVATLAGYRQTRLIAIGHLKTITGDITQNSTRILNTIDRTLTSIQNRTTTCNQNTILMLQKIVFSDPEIAGIFIATAHGDIVCSSMNKLISKLPVTTLSTTTKLNIAGPLHLANINKPIILIYEAGPQQLIFGTMILSETFTNIFTDDIATNGFVGLMDLDNNHLYVSVGIAPEIYKTYHFLQGEHAYTHLHVKSKHYNNPIIVAQRLRKLSHVYVVAAQPHYWFSKLLWHQSIIFGSIGLVCSILLITLVLAITRRRLSLAGELERAIMRQEFVLYYQPVIDIKANRCVGVEALLRWQHPQNGLIMPDFFVPLAEKNGQIKAITSWLIEQSMRDLQRLLQADASFHVALNIGAKFFEDDTIITLIEHVCSYYQVQPTQIILELTERELIQEDNTVAIDLMNKLRQLKVSLALDDFGTGYSSYSYLRQFPFNCLKIDQKFTAAIGTGAITEQLVDNIIDLAHKLQLTIIAEGIETELQLNFMKLKEVSLVQGWYYAKALTLLELLEFLET